MNEELDRRTFLLGASALAALCPIELPRQASTAASRRAARGKLDSYTIDLANAERKLDIYNVRLRNYGSPGRMPTIPGPLLETRGGHTLRVKLRNRITKAEGYIDGDMDQAPAGLDPHNNPHGFDITNLHVHGVQTVPHLFYPVGTAKLSAPSIAVAPGKSFTWDFPIPKDQPAGLFAYHPHLHGSTGTQVMSGAAGALIIRGAIDEVPEIKACREQVIAINSIYLTDAGQAPGRFGLNFTPYVSPPSGYTEEDFHIYTVNGQPVSKVNAPDPSGSTITRQLEPATLKMRPGEIVRLRFLNATETDTMRLVADGGDMRWYAQDGINFQKLVRTGTGADNCVFIPPLARSEVLLQAPAQAGEFFITALENAPQTYSFAGMPEVRMLRVVVGGAPK
ncbi:MAG: multicopper oxidase family protein, partial [Solirubrobacterales bacterium]